MLRLVVVNDSYVTVLNCDVKYTADIEYMRLCLEVGSGLGLTWLLQLL